MARKSDRGGISADFDVDSLSSEVATRFNDVPWKLFNSDDLASSGETRFMVSRIQTDLLKVASVDRLRAGRIWDEHVPDFVPRPVELPEADRDVSVVNGIEPGRRRRKLQAEPFLDASDPVGQGKPGADLEERPVQTSRVPAETAIAKATPGESGTSTLDAERRRLLTQGLEKQYLKADDKYHFRDRSGDVAFEARDKKLLTQHDTPVIVSSMIDLAETKGWSSLKLTGTKEFRREAWLQASVRNIEVSGYQPDKLDKARLDEIKAEKSVPNGLNAIERDSSRRFDPQPFRPIAEDGRSEPSLPLTNAQDQFLRAMEATMRHRGDSSLAIDKARALASERLTSERVHVGTFIEAGTAPYLDKAAERLSHFITLRDDTGRDTKVWGVDLPRALAASGAQPGQVVALAFRGRSPVSIDVPIKGSVGLTTRTERQAVERNTWDVVRFDRLQKDAKQAVWSAVKRQDNPAKLRIFDPAARPEETKSRSQLLRQRLPDRSI